MVAKILFILVLWTNAGEMRTNAVFVEACPPKQEVFERYENMKQNKMIMEWFVVCHGVVWDPNKPEDKEEEKEELKI